MKNSLLKAMLVIITAGLAGCSGMSNMQGTSNYNTAQGSGPGANGVVATSVDQTGRETNVNLTMAGGGDIGLKSMDANDKSKMSHALDNATGKSTHWENGVSGINFTVTPTKKVVIENNPFCRHYLVVVAKGNYQKQFNGTACVTTDGGWHTI